MTPHDEIDSETLPDNVIQFPGTRPTPSASQLAATAAAAPNPTPIAARDDTTLVAIQVRGWSDVVSDLGEDAAAVRLRAVVDAAMEVLGMHGGTALSLEGAPGQPDIFSTFAGTNGAQNAVTAAAGIRLAIAQAQALAAPEQQFRVGIGIDSARIGVDRTAEGIAYLSTGVIRASATRLRDFAGAGQIFLTDTTLSHAGNAITVQPLGPVRIEPDGESREAFSLTSLH